MKISKIFTLGLVLVMKLSFVAQITFNYTGGMQSYTVPPGTSAICFTVCGARGMANVQNNAGGGLGGRVMGTLPVTPGQVLQFFVGGGGVTSQLGGFNGGGNGGIVTTNCCMISRGGGGGGASDIRIAPYGLADRVAVGGGGGGTGGNRSVGCAPGCGGGGGGGWFGGGGGGAYGGSPGFGGTQVAGGLGGASCCGCPLGPQPGAVGTAGNGGQGGNLNGCNNQAANNPGCAGGVGGALVGGQGPNCTGGTGCPSTWAGASGGGGSNYTAPAVTGPTTTAGVQTGNGIIIINPNCCATPTIVAVANPTSICIGQTATLTGSGAGVGGTYTWQPGGSTNTIITVSPTVTTIYTLQGTNATSCTGQTTVQLVVNPNPTVTAVPNPSAICAGQVVTVTVGGAVNYTTNPGNIVSPGNFTIAPMVNTNYTVIGASVSGCTNSITFSVSVTPPPVITATNTGPYCEGATITLSVSTALSYSWTGPSGFLSNLQSPTILNAQAINAGIYTVNLTIGNCISTGTTDVVILPTPTVTAINNGPLCVNQQLNLTGGGGVTYTWTGPGGFASLLPNPVIAIAQASNAGIYTVTSVGGNGCVGTTTTNVVINGLPNVTTGNLVVCLNTPINLFANGATSYTWNGPSGYTSNLQNPVIASAQFSNQGQYFIVGASAQGCTNSAVANVTVLALPIASITANSPCVGGQLNLIGNGGTGYSWSGPNGFTSLISTPVIPNVSLADAGTYILIVASGNCTSMATKDVTINPLPTPTLSSNAPVCLHAPLQIFGSGGNSYQWVGPNGFTGSGTNINMGNASLTHVGIYTATATDLNGCENTATLNVTVNGLPVIGIIGSTLCATKTASLSASGGTAYAWNGPQGFSANTASVQIPDVTVSMTGDYTVTVTDINSCKSSSMVNVHVNPTPVITTSANSPICASQTVILSASSSTGVQYIWQGPNGFFTTQQNPKINQVETNAAGVYTVTVTDNIGCIAKAMVSMMIQPLPVVKITSDKVSGCVPICINFGTQSTTSLTTTKWDFGDGNTILGSNAYQCFSVPGTYNVVSRFTDVNGCSNMAMYSIEGYPIPVADFNISPSKPIINEPVELSDASQNATIASWNWSFNHLKANQIMNKPVVNLTYENAGTYVAVLIVTSDHGCKDTVIKKVEIGEDFGIFVPDAFSPNGDGINDVFQPKGFGITKYEMNIFDRWGEKLFTTTDFTQGWDGKFTRRANTEVKQDVYVWHVKLTNIHGKTKELTGTVNIIK